MCLSTFIAYLEKEKHYSAHTLSAYKTDIEQYQRFLGHYRSKKIEFADHQDIRYWISALIGEGLSARTVNRKLSCLKSLYKYLLRRAFIRRNPMDKVLFLKTSDRLPVFVPEKQLNRFLDSYGFGNDYAGLRDRLMIELFYQTGIRRSELINLREVDVHLGRGVIKVFGKRRKERQIPITVSFCALIREYLQAKHQFFEGLSLPYLLLKQSGGKLTEAFVYKKVNKYLRFACTLEQRSPHILRHSFATHMLNRGADLYALKELLGHSSLAATQVYTHTSFEQLKALYQKAHPWA